MSCMGIRQRLLSPANRRGEAAFLLRCARFALGRRPVGTTADVRRTTSGSPTYPTVARASSQSAMSRSTSSRSGSFMIS